jgi:hypothetical protein
MVVISSRKTKLEIRKPLGCLYTLFSSQKVRIQKELNHSDFSEKSKTQNPEIIGTLNSFSPHIENFPKATTMSSPPLLLTSTAEVEVVV